MPETDFVQHPLIEEGSLERRLYQESILDTAREHDTLVVLPTGLGKTPVAAMLAAHRLNKRGGKIMMLAPTRPLVEQHKRTFAEILEIAEGDMAVFTGKVRPNQREKGYGRYQLFFATPQVIQNDLISGRLDISEFSLLVLDECHRGTGEYPYPFIAEMYSRKAEDGRILGLTASPGSDREAIREITDGLHLDRVEIRTEDDEDVRPYTHKTETDWREVDLPPEFAEVQVLIREALKKRRKKLQKMGYLKGKDYLGKKDLLNLQKELRKKTSKPDPEPQVFQAISISAEALKIEHCLVLLETQGSGALLEYFKRMKENAEDGKTKAVKRVMNDARIEAALLKTYELVGEGKEHPKLDELEEIVEDRLEEGKRLIVFSHYRDSVEQIIETLEEMDGCRPVAFIGQSGESGLRQSEQIEILDRFEEEEYNVLVCTSVGEEGLDIPAVETVVFYEPVPSEIRAIQRRGRTGRHKAGEVIVLMAKDTRDEGIYWSSKHKEKRMKKTLRKMQGEDVQRELSDY